MFSAIYVLLKLGFFLHNFNKFKAFIQLISYGSETKSSFTKIGWFFANIKEFLKNICVLYLFSGGSEEYASRISVRIGVTLDEGYCKDDDFRTRKFCIKLRSVELCDK